MPKRREPAIDVVLERIEAFLGLSLHTTGEVAKAMDRTDTTVRQWRTSGRGEPRFVLWQRRSKIPLYSADDLGRLRKLRRNMKPGPERGTGGRPRRGAS